jgi:hypothetical protein
MWRLPRISGYSYPSVAAIWINVHPAGETWSTCYTIFMLGPPMTLEHTFRESSIGLDGCTAPEKKCSQLHLSARLSVPQDPSQFLFQHNYWSSALKPSIYWWKTTRLIGPISLVCDQYVQYLLMGANPSVLNRHRRGLEPWWCRLATSRALTFPTDGPPLST